MRRVARAPAQTIGCEQAASLVKSGMWLDYGVGVCQPDVFDAALGARCESLENVKFRSCLTMRPRAVLENDPEGQALSLVQLALLGLRPAKGSTMADAATICRSI